MNKTSLFSDIQQDETIQPMPADKLRKLIAILKFRSAVKKVVFPYLKLRYVFKKYVEPVLKVIVYTYVLYKVIF